MCVYSSQKWQFYELKKCFLNSYNIVRLGGFIIQWQSQENLPNSVLSVRYISCLGKNGFTYLIIWHIIKCIKVYRPGRTIFFFQQHSKSPVRHPLCNCVYVLHLCSAGSHPHLPLTQLSTLVFLPLFEHCSHCRWAMSFSWSNRHNFWKLNSQYVIAFTLLLDN